MNDVIEDDIVAAWPYDERGRFKIDRLPEAEDVNVKRDFDVFRAHRRVAPDTFEKLERAMGHGFEFVEHFYAPTTVCEAILQFLTVEDNSFYCLDVQALSMRQSVLRYTGVQVSNFGKPAQKLQLLFVRKTRRIMLLDGNLFVDFTRLFAPSGELVSEHYVATLSMLALDRSMLYQFFQNKDFGRSCICPVTKYAIQKVHLDSGTKL